MLTGSLIIDAIQRVVLFFKLLKGNTSWFWWALLSKPICTTLLTWRGHLNSEKVETSGFLFFSPTAQISFWKQENHKFWQQHWQHIINWVIKWRQLPRKLCPEYFTISSTPDWEAYKYLYYRLISQNRTEGQALSKAI